MEKSCRVLTVTAALLGAKCSGTELPATPDAASTVDAAPDVPGARTLTKHFGSWSLPAGGELTTMCTSWTLHNDETLYVNSVEMTATTGMHHSNWFFVPEVNFAGPDGDWPCAARSFEAGVAAFLGGVFFAQSTQAQRDAQRFPAGAAFVIPPRSRIVGALHQLNTGRTPASISMQLTVRTLARDTVRTRLSPFYLEYRPLSLPPRSRSQFEVECDLTERATAIAMSPLSMRFFYGLAHHHEMGLGMHVSVLGGAHDGRVLYENDATVGDSWARTMDPPVDVSGAHALKLRCVFDNPSNRTVHYGNGDGEMCIFFGYTDHPFQWSARANARAMTTREDTVDGVIRHRAPCNEVFAARSRYFEM